MLIQAIVGEATPEGYRGINASGGGLHVDILQAFGEAMLQIAQLND